MELMLNVDDEVAARAQACADRCGTTLDALVEASLREIGERLERVEAWVHWTREHAGRSEPGWRFDREAIYDRSILE